MKNDALREGELIHALEGVPIIGLFPHSPAEQAGILPGDLIIAVNEMRTRNVVDYIYAKRRRKSAMEIIFIRGRVYYKATVHWADDAQAPSPCAVARGQATKLTDDGWAPFVQPLQVSPTLS
jgi:predicted metalloprotease with PDZ domain